MADNTRTHPERIYDKVSRGIDKLYHLPLPSIRTSLVINAICLGFLGYPYARDAYHTVEQGVEYVLETYKLGEAVQRGRNQPPKIIIDIYTLRTSSTAEEEVRKRLEEAVQRAEKRLADIAGAHQKSTCSGQE
ncbi:hypothetical protein JW826_00345 [Candidatus Woesearchaeota archaeon]|nr:hypothetical protein [Candidatus Woesearchaeota archaeon]